MPPTQTLAASTCRTSTGKKTPLGLSDTRMAAQGRGDRKVGGNRSRPPLAAPGRRRRPRQRPALPSLPGSSAPATPRRRLRRHPATGAPRRRRAASRSTPSSTQSRARRRPHPAEATFERALRSRVAFSELHSDTPAAVAPCKRTPSRLTTGPAGPRHSSRPAIGTKTARPATSDAPDGRARRTPVPTPPAGTPDHRSSPRSRGSRARVRPRRRSLVARPVSLRPISPATVTSGATPA